MSKTMNLPTLQERLKNARIEISLNTMHQKYSKNDMADAFEYALIATGHLPHSRIYHGLSHR